MFSQTLKHVDDQKSETREARTLARVFGHAVNMALGVEMFLLSLYVTRNSEHGKCSASASLLLFAFGYKHRKQCMQYQTCRIIFPHVCISAPETV